MNLFNPIMAGCTPWKTFISEVKSCPQNRKAKDIADTSVKRTSDRDKRPHH